MRKSLISYTVSEQVFNYILTNHSWKQYQADLTSYLCGHSLKNCIMYNQKQMVVSRRTLSVLFPEQFPESETDHWYQVILQLDLEQSQQFIQELSVIQAVAITNKVIKKQYTQDQIDQIYADHQLDQAEILHVSILSDQYKINKFDNCYYYDLNSAYGSELLKLFPKCEQDLMYMFNHRKDQNGKYKKCLNYFVGCLTQNAKKRQLLIDQGKKVRADHSKTRNYIINNITNKVYNFMQYLNYDQAIYVNTDGLIVQNPKITPANNPNIGQFKLEYSGTVYTYRGANYTIIQYGDQIKGSLPLELRKYIDLSKGQVVEYQKVLNPDQTYKIINLKVVNINGK